MILLTKFAEERNEKRDTVATYIRRHKDLFEGHTKMQGNALLLDEDAIKILNEVYPLPKPVEVIVDTESLKKLVLEQEKNSMLENHVRALQDEIAELKADVLELTQEKLMIEATSEAKEQELIEIQARYDELKISSDKKDDQLAELTSQLEAERNKKWHQKLFESIKKSRS